MKPSKTHGWERPGAAAGGGDCFRMCVAAILNIDWRMVPHLGAENGDDSFHEAWDEWLGTIGFRMASMILTAESAQMAAFYHNNISPDVPCIVQGKTDSGANHAVVGMGGEIVYDASWGSCPIVQGDHRTEGYWLSVIAVADNYRLPLWHRIKLWIGAFNRG